MTSKIKINNLQFELKGETQPFTVKTSEREEGPGISLIQFIFETDKPVQLKPVTIEWFVPLVGIHHIWTPASHYHRTIAPDFAHFHFISRSTSQAPVALLHNINGKNVLTCALSDALNAIKLESGVVEETAMVQCQVTLFVEPMPPLKRYEVSLRLDTRPLPYYCVLKDAAQWWAGMPGYEPAISPADARVPLYSTWYSFHQNLSPDEIEKQCQQAKESGMEVVIVDDGWQTYDNHRGYAFCGDWEVELRKFPDFREHVARVHTIGLKYVLWLALPFVGIHSQAYQRFQDKVLNPNNGRGWFVLDPRFPDVRAFLVDTCCRFVQDYDVDGFKLDFVDAFQLQAAAVGEPADGRDYQTVPAAVDRLLSDILHSLQALKADILIEFRQTYTGPIMRKYGNMLRASDEPNNFAGNRVRTIDLRLLAGETAVHADPLMWHPDESVDCAALHFVHTLFAVPQVSVLLDQIPADHLRMIRFYLQFWRTHRDVLLDGQFQPHRPEHFYPVVEAATSEKRIVAFYGQSYVELSHIPAMLILVNGTAHRSVVLDIATGAVAGRTLRTLTVQTCCGAVVSQDVLPIQPGLQRIEIPPAGVAIWE